MFVSIIIPTYKDWGRLALCIDALSKQSFPKNMFEVIIINNEPNDPVPQHYSLPEGFQIIVEAKPGSYAARNAGLKMAKGSVIGFTDSDCIPDKDWIQNAVQFFSNNKPCSRIAGNVVVFPKSAKATVGEKYDMLFAFGQKKYVKNSGTCVTANLFAYKFVFERIGFFNDNQMSYGDLDSGVKAHEAGYRIDYVDNVIVNHPARDLKEIIKKAKRLAGGKEKSGKRNYNKVTVLYKFLREAQPRFQKNYKLIKGRGKTLTSVEFYNILFLKIFIDYVRAYETMRLRYGKKPNRE